MRLEVRSQGSKLALSGVEWALRHSEGLAERCSVWTDRGVRPHTVKGKVKGGGQECPPHTGNFVVNILLGCVCEIPSVRLRSGQALAQGALGWGTRRSVRCVPKALPRPAGTSLTYIQIACLDSIRYNEYIS